MSTEFSKASFKTFLDTITTQNLVNPHTASGYKAAATRILEQVADTVDVRSVDLPTEVRRYNNAHPGELSPASLGAYQRRVEVAIAEFTKYVNDPAGYKGRGRSPVENNGGASKPKQTDGKRTNKAAVEAGTLQLTGYPPTITVAPPTTVGLSLEFPLRADFLAQVVVPRDMKADEARRLTRFIMTLALDYDPLKE
jgi:hypothetical protein